MHLLVVHFILIMLNMDMEKNFKKSHGKFNQEIKMIGGFYKKYQALVKRIRIQIKSKLIQLLLFNMLRQNYH